MTLSALQPALLLMSLSILLLTFLAPIYISATSTPFTSQSLDAVLEHLYRPASTDQYDADLTNLVSFPSVSALPDHLPDLLKAADWLAERLKAAGLQEVAILPTDGPHPVVYGQWTHAPDALTVLIYGHYDVQPVDPLGEWETDPFRVAKIDGYYYGRGVDDDKGGLLQPIQAVEAWLRSAGSLPINVKFLLEGQEEVMSPHLGSFLAQHKELLRADLALSADGGQISATQGGISLGLRGVVSLQVDVTTAATDMHSGMKGGSVANPNRVLAQLLSTLHSPVTHRVLVKGFYEDVLEPSAEDRADINAMRAETTLADERLSLGLNDYVGEEGYGVLEQRWHRPTLEIVGMSGGFTGEGIKTVIPRTAFAKISCRLVPYQQPDAVFEKVRDHLVHHCPPHANITVTRLGGGASPWINPRDTLGNRAAARILDKVMGCPPKYLRDGATIPALAEFQSVLGIYTTKFGWGLGEKIHAPNERVLVEMYHKGRGAWAQLLWELGRPGHGQDAAGQADAGQREVEGKHEDAGPVHEEL